MINPLISLPLSSSRDPTKDDVQRNFVHHLGIICPIILQSPHVFDEDVVTRTLELVRLSECSLAGVPHDQPELIIKALDGGVLVVFFKQSMEAEVLKDSISTFPRTRIGVSSLGEPASYDYICSVLNDYSAFADHFLFR